MRVRWLRLRRGPILCGSTSSWLRQIDQAAAHAVQSSAGLAPARLLRHNPRLGDCAFRAQDFASNSEVTPAAIVGHYELRYEIRGEVIFVVRLWHTRGNR